MTAERTQGVHRTRIEWIDTDAAGIYHNSTVVRFVEAAEASLMRERGLADYFASAPRVRYEVDFLAPLYFGQEVTTTVTLAEVGTSSFTWEFEVTGEPDDDRAAVTAARGRFVTVNMGVGQVAEGDDAGARSARPWPADWLAALAVASRR